MRVELVRRLDSVHCQECNLSGMPVFVVAAMFGDTCLQFDLCAACLSSLGAQLQHNARVINRAPV